MEKKRTSKFKRIIKRVTLPRLLAVGGVILFIIASSFKAYHYYDQYLLFKTVNSTFSNESTVQKGVKPKRIETSNLSINTAVRVGGFINDKWILTNDSAFFVNTSGKLGEEHNTVIYAHNKPNLFQNLSKLEVGSVIIVTGGDNNKWKFTVTEKFVITPKEVEKLKTQVPNSLTLFTCNGLFDSERLVVRAALTP